MVLRLIQRFALFANVNLSDQALMILSRCDWRASPQPENVTEEALQR